MFIKQGIKALSFIPQAFRLLFQASPRLLILTGASMVAEGLTPAGIAFITKLLVDYLAAGRGVSSELWLLVGAELALALLAIILMHTSNYLTKSLRESTQIYVSTRIMETASRLDLSFFEMPGNYDQFAKARRETGFRPLMIVIAFFSLIQSIVTVVGFFLIILAFQPILALALLIASIPTLFVAQSTGIVTYNAYDMLTPQGRKAAYLERLLTEDIYAKEVRLFGLGTALLEQVRTYLRDAYGVRMSVERAKALGFSLSGAVAVLIQYVALAFVIWQVARGILSVGDFVLLATALATVRQRLGEALTAVGDLLENSLFLSDLTSFLSLKPSLTSPPNPKMPPEKPSIGLRLENVSFAYPGADKKVFDHLNLELRAGESTALVGVNGAGKTTLVKLLTRLYDPIEGRILLDGVDIREFDLKRYRQLFGVILQDFVRYQLSAKENIALPGYQESPDQARLECAARDAGILELIESLPEGWDTLLGRQFHVRGQDLSTGQWQRIALARALYRNAPILILDEPTAALDAEAEAELFSRYHTLTRGKLSLLITHRFNTVKMADRILVLEHGQVIEDGSHDELLFRGGRYAQMFKAQAEPYEIRNPGST